MDLNQLQAFDQILLQGSFSKAARRLNISQPSISLRIQALEQEVGGALFIRGGQRLQLTELGKNFAPHARQALQAMAAGLESAQHTLQGKKGQLMLGLSPTQTTGFFATALARLHKEQPALDIAVHTGHNQQIVEMLHEGFIQFGLVTGPFFSPEMQTIFQVHEPLIAMAHRTHPLARQQQVSIAELAARSDPFLAIDWSLASRYWQAHNLATQQAVVEVPPQTAYDLLLNGIGVAFMTRSFARYGLKTGALVELALQPNPDLHRESVVIQHQRTGTLSMAANEFLRILREETRGKLRI
ncbi:LysR family transcriptional regulator [Dictyobacter aurantiacus]|uniref:LysR family transcriptional regulator n=1 Tax=Dictyobacter aurantiacus TaxID=1936993 RepID=A0A401ZNS5_9CHLR|nr:LysR family transcriptional regulator [Dictyobacter aurantiacus]GCE08515.1 LysR family transcriptional regulator [Dictyobacter aurantiacus]